ncbi:bridge-like lipid transfer protein family member 3B isoform X1 [Euwallacea fornicatus]|uniref:bridge-like lipid transfer protein family member 3B isoform X1 n=1 Tax=Euwallacea fornicatus TaxID=995702 RepID=UPI00338E5227
MVSIIKNQLLKHLSRFTKNLSADKINLSTFKGEGELTNLELNEDVITDLLELPCWLRLTKAWCNKVTFRITWTKLKNVPICLSLDEVDINVETCEELRNMSNDISPAYGPPGKYSFIHKVIDGITVTVNTVNISFKSPAFVATLQIQRIVVESVSPKFVRMDLPLTRLKNPEKGQLLIFKELQWQTLRVEARSTKDSTLTPLRLLTNQARCRITIKKRLSDCFILGSRLVIILDDLLWVLTDSQLKAALHFLNSLSGLIERATQLTRKLKAARKLEELPEYQAQLAQEALQSFALKSAKASSRMFAQYDVIETSYHFLSNQIVLHLCDDPGDGRSSYPNLQDGGALQISIKRFQVDFYPYHLAKGDRKHWPTYNSSSTPHTIWQEQALTSFKNRFMDLVNYNKVQHTPLSRMPKGDSLNSDIQKPNSPNSSELKKKLQLKLNKLMTTSIVLRVDDFTVYRVTTSGKKQILKEFLCASHKRRDNKATGDRGRMTLPKDASIIHAEYIYYYYPSDVPFPVPPPKFYVQLNPILVIFDRDTCLWLNCFLLNLFRSFMDPNNKDPHNNFTYIDIKIEAILPRLNFESTDEYHNQRDRPKCLSIQVTRATITNVRSLEHSSRADLAKCIDSFYMGSLFFGSDFPSQTDDFYLVTQKFLNHISAADDVRQVPKQLEMSSLENPGSQLKRELFWADARDVWCIFLDPVYGDFLGAQSDFNKPIPFLEAVPITIWLHASFDPNSTLEGQRDKAKNADIHALAYISNLVSVQLNHYQYLFLMRLADQVSELVTFLNIDSDRIMKTDGESSLVVGAIIPQVEVTFVMPPQSPGKESSGGDGESFVPDFSSIDDITVGILRNSTRSIHQIENSGRFVTYSENTTILSQSLPEQSEAYATNTKNLSNSSYSPCLLPRMQSKTHIPNNINVVPGLSSVKKGFSTLMSSIDSALKQSPDDISDTISVRSDASSDSEQIVMINFEEDVRGMDYMFHVNGMQEFERVEEASEVLEEASTVTSTSDHSLTSSCQRKDLVCLSTFKLANVEFLQQSKGYSSSIKVQVGNILTEECSSIPWDEFQGKFSMRSRGWSENPTNSTSIPKVRVRLDHTLALSASSSLLQIDLTDRDNLKRAFMDHVIMEVKDLSLNLNMSTVIGLMDFVEDEIIPIPLPLIISAENIKIHLIEDRPPVNITSPGPIPIDLNVIQVYITRNEGGIFSITNQKPEATSFSKTHIPDESPSSIKLANLLSDNDELRRKLLAFERISEENRSLRKSKEESTEESNVLRNHLKSAQDDISKLLEEKKRLLDELVSMREQLTPTGNWKWNSKS